MRTTLALLLLLTACSPVASGATKPPQSGSEKLDFSQAAEAPKRQMIRVIDGDTVVIDGETIRIQNIDAPESGSRAKCMAEAALAAKAKQALTDALISPRPVVIDRSGKDRYGRTLALLFVFSPNDEEPNDVGDILHTAGVAAIWNGRRRDWCGLHSLSDTGGPMTGDPDQIDAELKAQGYR